jgi:glutamate dehydrogenase/leucine dehydrogenase
MFVSAGGVYVLELGQARGWFVSDFIVLGRCWGGVRVQPDVTLAETRLLARDMTLKSAMACIPVGGAKIGIAADPSTVNKKQLVNSLAEQLRIHGYVGKYIPGSDIGFSEGDLNLLNRCIGYSMRYSLHGGKTHLSKTGLAVAESLVASVKSVEELYALDGLKTVALQGFGNIGSAVAYLLHKHGYQIIAVSNKHHTLVAKPYIDVSYLLDLLKYGDWCLKMYADKMPGSTLMPPDEIFRVDADIHVPGARPLAIRAVPRCRVVAPVANYPISISHARRLEKAGIVVVPDIVSSAGGAIGSALSLSGKSFEENRRLIGRITHLNMVEVFSTARKTGVSLVEQAYAEAWRRFNILRRLGPAGLVSYLERWVIALGMDILTSLGRVLTYRP